METVQSDVLIVGGGIAGPALACALKDSGLNVTLIEKSDKDVDTARGDHLKPSTLEILDRWDVLNEFEALGAEKRFGTGWYQQDGEIILESWLHGLKIPHPYFFLLSHELISQALLAAAAQNPFFRLIKPLKHWRLRNSNGPGHSILLKLRNEQEIQVETRLLAGCDGSGSHVRKACRIEARTHRYECPIAVLFGRYRHENPGNALRVYLSGSKIIPIVPRIKGACKIGIPLTLDELKTWRSADSGEITQWVRKLVPALEIDDIRFGSVYPPVSVSTEQWVTHNTVLLGDACHAMHPARSQGMNTAIQCVDELVKRLPVSNGSLDQDQLAAALLDYQETVKPGIDRLLESNHQSGLEMDNPEKSDYQHLAVALAQVQSVPKDLLAYTMNMAGY